LRTQSVILSDKSNQVFTFAENLTDDIIKQSPMTTKDIKLLIFNDKIEQAAVALFDLTSNDGDLQSQVILLKSQFNDYNRNVNLNLTERSNERTKVVNGLLFVVQEIEKNQKTSFSNPPSANQNTQNTEGGVFVRGQQDVLALLWMNTLAFFVRDPQLYIMTLHEQNPQYQYFVQNAPAYVSQDYIYEVKSMDVVRYETHEALIDMETIIRNKHDLQGGKVTKNRVTVRRNMYGVWKIWSWEMQEFKGL
jgi:hypothetical protein